MTIFLRALCSSEKAERLRSMADTIRSGTYDKHIYDIQPELFRSIPGAPFAYWGRPYLFGCFSEFPSVRNNGLAVRVSNETGDDFRFMRLWLEIVREETQVNFRWVPHAKGGTQSDYYCDLLLVIGWNDTRGTIHGYAGRPSRPDEIVANAANFFRPGLTFPRRTNGFSVRVLPRNATFGNKGPAVLEDSDDTDNLLCICAIMNSAIFEELVSLQLARTDLAQSFEVGIIQQTPMPVIEDSETRKNLVVLARLAWSLKRRSDSVIETSHAFLLPGALRARLSYYNPITIEAELTRIQSEIDEIAFDLYRLDGAHRAAIVTSTDNGMLSAAAGQGAAVEQDEDDEENEPRPPVDDRTSLLSWCIGVAFGRFDWRLATGEREAPPESDPFDPLALRSPGMLPDGSEPFHEHAGILVDDLGHPHDLARLVESVLERVDVPAPADVRRWLRRDFFPYHLKRYSKSRRKAPIYWPLSTASGSYTIWLYYPALIDQTLYTVANDFVGPKLEDTAKLAAKLRARTDRNREDERALEQLQDLEAELRELQDELLRLAPSWKPNHNDGVQITAAPLWRLFRYKPWQKTLKETWAGLEAGDYDWAHLAMVYRPRWVREKCQTDKSLAIAHGLEELYEPQARDAAKV